MLLKGTQLGGAPKHFSPIASMSVGRFYSKLQMNSSTINYNKNDKNIGNKHSKTKLVKKRGLWVEKVKRLTINKS